MNRSFAHFRSCLSNLFGSARMLLDIEQLLFPRKRVPPISLKGNTYTATLHQVLFDRTEHNARALAAAGEGDGWMGVVVH